MDFRLTRQKSLELKAFIRAYYSSDIIITDHNGVRWLAKFTSNPFEFSAVSTSEGQNIHLEFEGTQL
jgi:hypothetical protein